MNSLFFSLNNEGYQITPTPVPAPINHRKRIPVYKIISQPMMSKPKAEQVETIPEQQQIDIPQPQTARSLDVNLHKKIKYVIMNTDRLHEKQETTSIYQNESIQPNYKEKDNSVQDTTTSMIDTLPKSNSMQLTSIEFYKGRTPPSAQYKDKSLLMLELNKQKILRENLQKSYDSLLEKINLDSQLFQRQEGHSQTVQKVLEYSSRITDRYEEHTTKKFVNSQNRQNNKIAKLSKSCHTLKQNHDEGDRSSMENELHENQRQFRAKLFSELLLCQDRIESIQFRLNKRQQQLQNALNKIDTLQKENQILKLTQTNQFQHVTINPLDNNNRKREGLAMRQHLHYLFTIIILFFIVVLLTKKQQ